MPKNINLKIDQTTYEIIILQNKIPYISRGLTPILFIKRKNSKKEKLTSMYLV